MFYSVFDEDRHRFLNLKGFVAFLLMPLFNASAHLDKKCENKRATMLWYKITINIQILN